ncbi:MAG: hypothetical protein NT033_04330, partial [Candidatus Omnitrophica bacterium]|nr:hypothetical protein [Candidatus Omnitrophota bacterium]
MKPEHLVKEAELNGNRWYIGMNNNPRFKYHMLVVPKVARPMLPTAQDLADMQRLLADIGDSRATLLNNSLDGGAGVNSLHFHLHFHDFPIFEGGFRMYPGTEQYKTKVFDGANCAAEAGAYVIGLQRAGQPYNIIMRLGKIIIIPRPSDLIFKSGADDLAGSVFYGKDKTFEEAKGVFAGVISPAIPTEAQRELNKKIAKSKEIVAGIKEPIKVALVFAWFSIDYKAALERKKRELNDLYKDNPNISPIIVVV